MGQASNRTYTIRRGTRCAPSVRMTPIGALCPEPQLCRRIGAEPSTRSCAAAPQPAEGVPDILRSSIRSARAFADPDI